jgi:hypothetical protein
MQLLPPFVTSDPIGLPADTNRVLLRLDAGFHFTDDSVRCCFGLKRKRRRQLKGVVVRPLCERELEHLPAAP